jgi:hypothetical protein
MIVDLLTTLLTKADPKIVTTPIVERVACIFNETSSGSLLFALSSCLRKLAAFGVTASAILGAFLCRESGVPSLRFSLKELIHPDVPPLPDGIPRDVFQKRILLLVIRLLPWSDILATFLPRERDSDPDCCFHFAFCIRAPLLAVLPAIDPADATLLGQGLIALVAAYAHPNSATFVLDTSAADAHTTLSAESKSHLELTSLLLPILTNAARSGSCREVLSVLDRCTFTPESVGGCASILKVLKNQHHED